MTKLNLTAKGRPQELILAYLQKNASDILAEKINNGTPFEKDGKILVNKKTLDGFMKFANGEAKKLAEKGETSACVEDSVVYGWAIHYFEEDSIEGTLYNEDGTEYNPPKPVQKKTTAPAAPPKPKAEPQLSLFDMLSDNSAEESAAPVENDEEPTKEEIREAMKQGDAELQKAEQAEILPSPASAPLNSPAVPETKLQGSPMYQRYLSVKEKYKDCIVLYRLGDFYEMFGKDAISSANELNLTLTGRDCGLAERVPMTGIPYHAVDAYISRLVERGYKVAVAEPVSGGNREVRRIIEPEPLSPSVIDEETGEILTEAEMRQFDGDIQEPKDISAVMDIDDDFDLEKEREKAKAFDTEVLVVLSDLLGDIFILE